MDNIDSSISLDGAIKGKHYVVHHVLHPDSAADWPQRLEELGFLPGERVTVMAHVRPGSDPLAVRVGHSTFALRRQEAACVLVRAEIPA